MGSFNFAEETASRRDSIEIQRIRMLYLSSLRVNPLVLLCAQCIAPIHARITWDSYQYISSWVGSEAFQNFPVPQLGIEPGTSGMVDQSVTTRLPHNPTRLLHHYQMR
ncbi:hypothetical protein DPMN_058055 [Dreissena polymorpha]|uniref:Uncharacterized protein n=1 Tax=Dreissena polymorpha TaxID=45954 RepID=A0A9D4C1F9_DREPO|nr:hypothetical protein DPMN_058055 [Dreissena polymorpha]